MENIKKGSLCLSLGLLLSVIMANTFTHKGTTFTMEDMYNALAEAETGSWDNPFRRTSVSTAGSTAYGPVQLTSGSSSMIQNILSGNTPKLFKQFTKDEIKYMNDMVIQGKKFLKYGNEPKKVGYESKYDYSKSHWTEKFRGEYGTGELGSDQKSKDLYKSVATKIIGYEMNRIKNVGNFINEWRGTNDSSYSNKVMKNLKSTYVPGVNTNETMDNRLFDFMINKTEGVDFG